MKKVDLFVSMRTDINSKTINNPLYFPVLCGSILHQENKKFARDDIGENISVKKNYYSELTVQYWAWNNVESDYYGLCHYRRYLSFTDKKYKINSHSHIVEPMLTRKSIKRHRLDDSQTMLKEIEKCDAIFPHAADVCHIPTPDGLKKTVRELWEAHDNVFIHKADLDILLDVIQDFYPEYVIAAKDYLSGTQHIGYNCFIMCRRLFFEMCQFQFDILFELEKKLDLKNYLGNTKRTLGYMGEILFGIYASTLLKSDTERIITRPLVYFEETRVPHSFMQGVYMFIVAWFTCVMRRSFEHILPYGSKRRETMRNIVNVFRKITA